MVVEGVEQHADIIVVEDVVALGDVRANLRRIVITMESYVKKSWIVT